jgi:hypothetical protein
VNRNDYGVLFVYGVGENLSAYSGLTLEFDRPDGTTLTVTSPLVTTSTNPIVTSVGTLLAEEYAQYTFRPGDVTVAGVWSVRLTYDAPGPIHLTSNATTFTVGP